MKLAEAVQFVHENMREISSDCKFRAENLGCIDDRDESDHRFKIPGAGIGLVGVVAATLRLYEKMHGQTGVAFDRLTKAIEGALGGMSCHTDTDAISKGKTSIVAGCGHFSGIIEMSDEYGVGDFARLMDVYVADLKNRGVNPDVLKSGHGAEAVILIAQADNGHLAITLPGRGKNGQVFVCHLEDWVRIAMSFVPYIVKCAAKNIDEAKLRKCIKIAALHQLNVTLKRLALGLPVYRVSRDKSGIINVELMAEDAATAFA